MVLINEHWEDIYDINDISKIIRENYNRDLSDELDKYIHYFECREDGLLADIEDLEDECDELQYDINSLEDYIEELKDEISELQDKIEELKMEK